LPRVRHNIVMLLLTVLLAPLLITLGASPAQAIPNRHQIMNANGQPQLCLDVRTQDHETVQMWGCSGAPQKRWTMTWDYTISLGPYATIFNQLDGNCLRAPTLSGGPDEIVTVVPCEDNLSTKWRVFWAFNPPSPLLGWYQVWQNLSTFTCLYLRGNLAANGTRIETRTCDKDDPAQKWHLEDV